LLFTESNDEHNRQTHRPGTQIVSALSPPNPNSQILFNLPCPERESSQIGITTFVTYVMWVSQSCHSVQTAKQGKMRSIRPPVRHTTLLTFGCATGRIFNSSRLAGACRSQRPWCDAGIEATRKRLQHFEASDALYQTFGEYQSEVLPEHAESS